MRGLLRSTRAELLVLRHSPGIWALVLVVPVLTLLNDYIVDYVFYKTAETGTAQDLGSPLQLLYALSPNQTVTVVTAGYATLAPAVAVVLGALVAGGEWGRGSLKTALAQGPSRTATALGQGCAVMITLAASVVANFGLAALASEVIATVEADQATTAMLTPPAPGVVLQGAWTAILISAANGAIGLALGTLFRSTGAAIGAALIWYVGSQVLLTAIAQSVGGGFTTISQILPNASSTTLATVFGPVIGGPVAEATPPAINPALAPWVLLAYLVAVLAIHVGVTRHRDVT